MVSRPRSGTAGPRGGRGSSRGFSLVEMMVAIVVSMILMAGVIQLLVGNKQAYRIQEGLSRLNENARFAIFDMSRTLRMADHWGGVEPVAVSVDGTVPSVSGNCTQAGWSVFSGQGLFGYEGDVAGATSPMTGCIPDADYVPNSDILVARYGGSANVLTAAATSAPLNANMYVRSAVGRRAEITQGTRISSLGSDLYDSGDPDQTGTYNYPYSLIAYFVRPCSSQGTDGVCDASDDGGNPIPTLVRLTLNGTTLEQQDVVEGVEQMQVVYGVNTDGDSAGTADRYFTADQVTAADNWSRVVAVRVSLVVRNPERDVAAADTNTYTMVGGYVYDPATADEQFARRMFTNVIQVRNQNRS